VNNAEVGVLEEVDEVVLCGVLKCEHGLTLPAAEGTLQSTKGSLKCWRNRHNDRVDGHAIVSGARVTETLKP
jgi:hypothetical protein